MTDKKHPRAALGQAPADILSVLPAMGRVMLSARSGGATHERMGPVETVEIKGATARLGGREHHGRIDLTAVSQIVADRTSRMRDRILPRLECRDTQGETLFSLIALEGLDLFDAALAPFGEGEPQAPVERPAAGGASQEVSDGDLGALSLAAIAEAGYEIAIDIERPGLFQRWAGLPPQVRPAMGFVNLMQEDFHLHLKAGSVAKWLRRTHERGLALEALDPEGRAFGLVLRGPAAAFEAVPKVVAHHG